MSDQLKIPLAFANKEEVFNKEMTVLAADVGGTKTNLALYKIYKGDFSLVIEKSYHSSKYPTLIDIINLFISENNLTLPDRVCAGVAGPIIHGKAKITNLSWDIVVTDICKQTGVNQVHLLNDLEATGYGLARLTKDDILTLHEGDASVQGNIAIIAPGTGLGEAGLFWDGSSYHPFPTEGGHCDFCPRTDLDIALFRFLQKKYGIVSWEKAVAGPGIHDIYIFLRSIRNGVEPTWLSDALLQEDPTAVISHAAVEKKDAVCCETMELFVRYLARESSNLVLKMKATGGLFIGGGIPPKIAPLLQDGSYYKNYLDSDRMEDLLQQAPLHIITNENTALIGAAYYGAYGAF
ncbi:MAG TPA: glucokinase [Puia sp.]|jgi:glucokinase|nr:glucokinase [Puia sp.]